MFLEPIVKTRWLPLCLIGWDIFDFFSETAERNSTKLNRKQELNILYQVFLFFGPVEKTRWPPWPLIDWDIFNFSSETAEWNSTKLDRKQYLNVLYQVCVFGTNRKNKMAAIVSDWLRHFRLLLWNCWTEFNETWQEARSQRPLPSLCFSGRSKKKKWQPWGCSSVILLRPKMGVEPPKHDVITMPTQQYTNTNYISLERYHLVVSIMLRHMDQIKTFNDNFE